MSIILITRERSQALRREWPAQGLLTEGGGKRLRPKDIKGPAKEKHQNMTSHNVCICTQTLEDLTPVYKSAASPTLPHDPNKCTLPIIQNYWWHPKGAQSAQPLHSISPTWHAPLPFLLLAASIRLLNSAQVIPLSRIDLLIALGALWITEVIALFWLIPSSVPFPRLKF